MLLGIYLLTASSTATHMGVRLDYDEICLPRVNPAAIHNKDNIICSFVSGRSLRGWYDD